MDPYSKKNHKMLSPLDKEEQEEVEKETEENPDVDEKSKEPATEQEQADKIEIKREEEPTEDEENAALQPTKVMDHLRDLRKQLVKSAVVFLLFFIVTLSTINYWFPYLTRGHKLIILSPMDVISFYTAIAAALALGLSIPFLTHFIWDFVKPGLNEKETKFFSLYSPIIFILFVIGLAFGYFVLNPLSYSFLVKLGAINFDVMISAREYARFLLLTTLPIGLMFELPIVALFLSSIGILNSTTMKKVRKWSYISIAVISALITPPDFMSQLIVLVPMVGLYEMSIYLVTRIEKKKQVNEWASS